MHRTSSRRLLAAVCLLPVLACDVRAQAKLSEPATVAQSVDGTKITVDYSRPSARGRAKIFGAEVHWDEVWTPGANWATTLETDKDVTLEGRAVPKGKYSVWLVVKEQGDWTLLLAKEARLFHTNRPTAEQEFARIPVAPQWIAPGAQPVETLTWDFPVVKPDRMVLRLQWGTLTIPLHIAVQPSRTLTAEQRARVVGAWTLTRASGDRSAAQPARTELRITDEGGRLRARFAPALAGHDEAFDLFAAGSSWFFPIYYERGAPAGAETDLTLYFEFEGGKVKEVTVSDAEGTLARGPAR